MIMFIVLNAIERCRDNMKMKNYTDTENTGAPAVPFLYGDESAEMLEEEIWSHRIE
jgi:hypothetical protein